VRRVPIFPLPATVFFPATVLPLHLFEPRYRQMGRDVIEGDGELVVVLLKPGWESNYEGTPPVYETATLGTLEDHEELEDGRLNIVLQGRDRVRLLPPDDDELSPGKLYRERRVEPARERQPLEGDNTSAITDRLRSRWEELLERSGASDTGSITPLRPFGEFVNLMASAIDIPPRLKQTLLEEDDLWTRAARLEGFMQEQLKFWRTLAAYRKLKPEDPSIN